MAAPFASDGLWSLIAPLLPAHLRWPRAGRPAEPERACFTDILLVRKGVRPNFRGQQASQNARTSRRIIRPDEPGRSDLMRKGRCSPEQILAALRQAEGGTAVADVIRKLGITETFVYRWKKQYAGLDVGELRELKPLREEHAKLRQVVADLVLDKTIVKDALGKEW